MMEDDVMMKLQDDVLIEILIYLSVKSLMRFKCVSKCWCALIKSPTFVTRHLKCDKKEILLLKRYLLPPNSEQSRQGGDNILSFHDPDSPNSLVSSNLLIPFFKDIYSHDYIYLYGPCNGLICLGYHDIVIFSNPALREFELLPPSPFAFPEDYYNTLCASGFGFDANTNAYKVIHLWNVFQTRPYVEEEVFIRTDLYNSRTHSWKLIYAMVPRIRFSHEFNLFFNGAWHWQLNEFLDGPPAMAIILSFEISSEIFHQFEFPDCFEGGGGSLMVLNECMAMVRFGNSTIYEPDYLDIWVMKEYGVKESWIKEFVIGPYFVNCKPLLSWKNEWVFVEISEKSWGVETRISELASCALHAGHEMKKFQFDGMWVTFRALIFKESLVSLNQLLLGGLEA